ncbi:unnamed protein product [Peronospora belbahrii]|uniref:Reverse transcriptase RNase H-like domain-containing protein n=1 Tax=Peronospora belbahrii TaxID=622444 RepID=A0AAU9L300_9STRA|nr:unnamed protein product [Peronospora belbahrii]
MLPDASKPFHAVCDASNFAIGCALMQCDDGSRERVVSSQRPMKPAERNYPAQDKEPLAMRYALIKFRAYLLVEKMFSVYTDHVSLPRKNKILADALPLRPDYYPRRDMGDQPGSADDEDDDIYLWCTELGLNAMFSTPELPIRSQIAKYYSNDSSYSGSINYFRHPGEHSLAKLTKPTRDNIKRYALDGPLLTFTMDVFDHRA